jgi:SAM-dependent methyltransferase
MSENSEFYDKPNIQAQYFAHHTQPDNPKDTLERPLFRELTGSLKSLDIVDLGCGDAAFGQEALSQGARSYVGIEASRSMVALARQALVGVAATIHHQQIESWQADDEQADLVTSRLALNYVEHLQPVFDETYRVLRPGGRMIVSVEHPVISSNYAYLSQGRRTTWLVDRYFQPGARVHQWLGQEVTKYHHTLEKYCELMIETGFNLIRIRESCPQRENFTSQEEYDRRLRIPLFLLLVVQKPSKFQRT